VAGESRLPVSSSRAGGGRKPRERRVVEQHEGAAPIDPNTLILVGRVAGAFGVKGEIKLRPYTVEGESVASYGPLFDAGGRPVLTPRRARPIAGGVAVTAAEVSTREEAEALKGTKLFVPRTRLPALEPDEFYAVDLIGCRVSNVAGADLGVVTGVDDFGAGDLLEITSGKTVWRLPFTAENAPHIDLNERRIIVDPPAGLPPDEV
jgi:16S rRNA processing protein RimM